MNPNNCETCDYKKLNGNREKGWCYMFKDEPTEVCKVHSGRKVKHFSAVADDLPAELQEILSNTLIRMMADR